MKQESRNVEARACVAAEVHGAETVALQFMGRAHGAQPALVNGSIGVLVGRRDQPFFVLNLAIANGKIIGIEGVGDLARLRNMHLSVLAD